MKKYAILPNYVTSTIDGDMHFISASHLMRLYKVKPAECIVIDFDRPETRHGYRIDDLISLSVREDGRYNLPAITGEDTMIKIELRVTYWMDRKAETVSITEADLVDLVQHKMTMRGIACHVKAIEIVPGPADECLVEMEDDKCPGLKPQFQAE